MTNRGAYHSVLLVHEPTLQVPPPVHNTFVDCMQPIWGADLLGLQILSIPLNHLALHCVVHQDPHLQLDAVSSAGKGFR